MPEDLVSKALDVRQPPAGLIAHSNQGSQYTATRFQELVARHQALPSVSRRLNCYDNAHAESFWSRLKTELLDGGSFPGLALDDLLRNIAESIAQVQRNGRKLTSQTGAGRGRTPPRLQGAANRVGSGGQGPAAGYLARPGEWAR